MKQEPRGLGKGLGSLLGEISGAETFKSPLNYVNSGPDVLKLSPDSIEPNPYQPRTTFDEAALEELADSIRNYGLIQPITVRRVDGGKYQIISGERRFRACRLAGITAIPAYLRDASEQGMHEMAIVENVQRADLDPIELALGYQRLIDECALTQEQLSERVGKNRATVANTLRLLKLTPRVQHDLKLGLISQGHAKALLAIEDDSLQEELCSLAVRDGMSVRELEELVRKTLGPVRETDIVISDSRNMDMPESYTRILNCIGKYFSRNISIRRNTLGKGSMTIRFNSDKEVDAFVKALEEANL